MPTDPARVQELFLAALELPADARAAYLDDACAGELRARVEALLRAHDRPDSLLDGPVVPLPGGDAPTRTHAPGSGPRDAATGPDAGEGFELGEEIGRGANGVVYRARQRGLNRVVAVKVALGLEHAARQSLARFLAEAEAVAAIDHPHVVRVYGFGQRGGVPYIAMEYLGGGTLADRLKGDPLDSRAAAGLIAKVASGVAAAHAQGIVHRDLKPGNVLLDEAGEPKVTDFGLARRGGGADLTATGAVMGTPAYMAPEQARGGGKFVGPPADVWSLGVMLYECVARRRPFEGESDEALLAQIASTEPPALGTLASGVPRDLETIVAKCHAKEPERRYPTATELADDLGRFVRGEPITARPVGRVERLYRWALRKPAVAALYAAVSVATVLLGVVGAVAWQWLRAESARKQGAELNDRLEGANEIKDAAIEARDAALAVARGEQEKADRARENIATFEYGRTVQLAHQAWRDGDFAGALKTLDGTRPDLRGWEWHYVRRLCNTAPVAKLPGWRPALGAASAYWSPDGTRFAAVSGTRVAVFDAATGKELVALDGDTGLSAESIGNRIAFNADGSRLLTWGGGPPRLWDAATGKLVAVLPGAVEVSWSRDGARVLGVAHPAPWQLGLVLRVQQVGLAVAGVATQPADWDPPVARRWDARTGAELPTRLTAKLRPDGGAQRALWNPDGTRLAAVTGWRLFGWAWGRVRVFDADSGAETLRLPPGWGEQGVVAWSPGGSRLVTCTGPRHTRDYWLWDTTTGARLPLRYRLNEHFREWYWPPPVVQFSDDGRRMVFSPGRISYRRQAWNPAGREEVPLPDDLPPEDVQEFVRGPRGELGIALYRDGTRRLVDSKTWESPPAWKGVDLPFGVNWSPGGRWLTHVPAVTGPGGKAVPGPTVRVWDAATGRETQLRGHAGGVNTLVWSPDERKLATGSSDKTVRVWDSGSGLGVALKEHAGGLAQVAWSPDGRRLLTTAADGRAHVWDAVTGAELASLRLTSTGFDGSPWSPDGERVVLPAADRSVRDGLAAAYVVWDAAAGKQVHTFLSAPQAALPRPVWRPDGTRLLFPSERGLGVWDTATWREVAVLKEPGGQVHRGEWSTDGARVLTSDGTSVTVWDPDTGAALVRLAVPNAALASAAWQPGGRRILTHSDELVDAKPVEFGIKDGGGGYTHWKTRPETTQVVRVWDADSGALIRAFRTRNDPWSNGSWSPDGKRVQLQVVEHSVAVFDVATGTRLAELTGHQSLVTWAALSPDGGRVVTCSSNRIARVWDAATGTQLAVLEGHASDVLSATWTRDGWRIVTTSKDKTAQVWDAATGKQLARLAWVGQWGGSYIGPATPAPGGDRLLAAPWDGIEIWDLRPARLELGSPGHAGSIARGGLAWTRDGKLVTAGVDGTVRMFDPTTGRELSLVGRHTGPVTALAYSPSGREFVTASADGTARVWDARTGRHLGLLEGHRGTITGASFSPDGTRIVTTSADGSARVWAVPPGGLLPQPPVAVLENASHALFPRGAAAPAWSPDGRRLAVAYSGGLVWVWDTQTWRPAATISGNSVLWSPRGDRILVTAFGNGNSGEVEYALRDAATGRAVWPAGGGFGGWGAGVTWAPDGRHFLVFGGEGGVLRDAGTGEAVDSFDVDGGVGRRDPGQSLAATFSPDGERLLTGAAAGCRIRDVGSKKQVGVLGGDRLDGFVGAVWSQAGSRVATGHADGSVRVWDAAGGKLLAEMDRSPTTNVSGAVWNPDGAWVLTTEEPRERDPLGPPTPERGTVWDVRTGRPVPGFQFPAGAKDRRWPDKTPIPADANPVTVSPDGTRKVEVGPGNTVRVLHAATGAELLVLRGEADGLFGPPRVASWSPDGHRIVVAAPAAWWDRTGETVRAAGPTAAVLDATPLGR